MKKAPAPPLHPSIEDFIKLLVLNKDGLNPPVLSITHKNGTKVLSTIDSSTSIRGIGRLIKFFLNDALELHFALDHISKSNILTTNFVAIYSFMEGNWTITVLPHEYQIFPTPLENEELNTRLLQGFKNLILRTELYCHCKKRTQYRGFKNLILRTEGVEE